LIVLIDDLCWDELGCSGHPYVKNARSPQYPQRRRANLTHDFVEGVFSGRRRS
jgi:hypothetical protein